VQPLVVVEDPRLQLPQARPRLDPELLNEVLAGSLVRRQRVGLSPGPVQRGHQQRPQPLPERVVGRQLGKRGDRRRRVGGHAPAEVVLDRAQPLLDQPVHRGRQARDVQAGQRRAGPRRQCGVHVARTEVSPEPGHVDRVGNQVQPVGRPDPRDRVGPRPLRSRAT
jgi:hypothetical protein